MRPGWYAACLSRELHKPLARQILHHPVALFRGARGEAAALIDRCPHRNAPLSAGAVSGGCLQCPYHGWRFAADGALCEIPGLTGRLPKAAAQALPVQEAGGLVFVRSEPGHDLPYLPTLAHDRNYHSFGMVFRSHGNLLNAVENLLDATHTHFVHAGLIRTEGRRRPVLAIVRRGTDRVEVEYRETAPQSGWIARLLERERSSSFGRFILPCVAELEYRDRQGITLLLTSWFTPPLVHSLVYTRRGRLPLALKKAVLGPLLGLAARQDLAMLRLQQRTIEGFGEERFASSELDLIRPHLEVLLARGPGQALPDREVELAL